ncbi:MAG: hypothetical protein ACOYL5_17955 [Phototrophicaceae bacterium]
MYARFRIIAFISAFIISLSMVSAQEGTQVRLTDEILSVNPERFGANLYPSPMSDMNMWIQDGTEPTITRLPATATGGGVNFILNETDPQTDVWDTLGEGFFEGGRVRVYRIESDTVRLVRDSAVVAYHATDASGYRIELGDSGEAIQAGDYYIVERLHLNSPNALSHPRLEYLKNWEVWSPITREWVDREARVNVERVTDAVHGQASLLIESQETGEAGVGQYNVYPPSEGSNAYDPNASYTLDLWLKQTGIGDGRVHVWFGQYPEQVSQWFEVGTEWAQYSFSFTGLAPLEAESAVNTVNISFVGTGRLWMDNPRIYNQNAEPYALIPEAKQALLDYQPGVLRIWSGHTNTSLGQTLDAWLAPPGANSQQYDVNNGMSQPSYFSLPEALQLVQEVGGTPWLIVNPSFSEQEWLQLIEYLAGAPDTPYGALRAERGQVAPWTEVFDQIHLELGNETWNGMFLWTYAWDGSLGKFANYFYGVAQSAPAFDADKLSFVLGGFLLTSDEYGYGQQAMRYAPQANRLGVTAYIGGWDSVDVSGGDLEAKYRNILTFTPQIFGVLSAQQAQSREQLAEQGVNYQLVTYEGGPGYALPDPQNPFDPETERLGKSLASATSTLEAFLYNSTLGFESQAYFSFAPGANWSSHTTVSKGYRAHVPWLALQLRNQHCTGAMLATEVSNAPTVDLAAITGDNPFPAVNDLPLIASYAFRDERQLCLIVLSRSLDQAIPVTLNMANQVASSGAMLYRLTGDPRHHNIDALMIDSQSEALEGLDGYRFEMPAGSIYLFTAQLQP